MAECDCQGEWSPLEEVKGAEIGFPTWNYAHALGGHTLTCRGCGVEYVLGGHVEGRGLPDLIEAEELYQVPRVELTRVQRRLLDVSLTTESVFWEKSMDLIKQAKAEGDEAKARGLKQAAHLMRGVFHREKRETVRAILLEHGIDGVPPSLRIGRTSDGLGCIYDVNRRPLPVRAKELQPEERRVVDLSEEASFREFREVTTKKLSRLVDLS